MNYWQSVALLAVAILGAVLVVALVTLARTEAPPLGMAPTGQPGRATDAFTGSVHAQRA